MGKLGKHDHKLTNLLKGGIFSLIMLAPLIAIGVQSLYVINNKNAYQSYSSENLQSISRINNNNQFIEYENYHIEYHIPYTPSNANSTKIIINFYETTIDFENLGFNQPNINGYSITYNNTNQLFTMYVYNDETQLDGKNVVLNKISSINIKLKSVTSPNAYKLLDQTIASYDIYYLTTNKLDNVFYYSIHNLEEQETFNWVQNTAIYTPLNAMCSGLGITESAIPILLTYWALMTLIYIVFDIIIYLFTKMTHFLGTN